MKLTHLLTALAIGTAPVLADTYVSYPPKDGPGKGKHVVFISGDEEYRSEEGLPMLAKILSQRHGFKCTVLFSLADDGTINPNNQKSLSAPEQLDSADAIVMLVRFRQWPEDATKHFTDAINRGVPVIGLRTATHAFSGYPDSSPNAVLNWNNKEGGWGKQVLGETWVSHWGGHKSEATNGIIEPGAEKDPILQGVTGVFGLTDVYEAHPPADAKILLRGQVLKGLVTESPAADYKKGDHGVNDPMMPIAWTRSVKSASGKTNKVLCTTMGDATDLESQGLRRLLVNGVFWGLDLPVPDKADVTYVDEYQPSFYSGDGYRKGMKPEDLALGKPMPGTPHPKPAGAK